MRNLAKPQEKSQVTLRSKHSSPCRSTCSRSWTQQSLVL